jgi:hypothetical protein
MADPDFRITGQRPRDRAMQQSWDRQGLQPYSICDRVNGRWQCHSYARVDPISALLGMATDMAHHVATHPTSGDLDSEIIGMAIAAAAGLYEYTLEQPFAQGISDMARLFSERQAEPGSTGGERAAGLFAEKIAGVMFMPLTGGTVGAAIERAMAPETMSTLPEDGTTANANPIRRGFDRALQQARGRIPGESDSLEPRLNIFGETVRPTEGGFLPLFWPFRITSGRADALEDRLMALGGVLTMPDDKFPQTNVRLTAGQYNWIVRRMNEGAPSMREEMLDLVTGPGFDMLDPKDQIAAIKRIRETRLKAAREAALDEFPDLNRLVTRDREVRAVMGRSPPVEVE